MSTTLGRYLARRLVELKVDDVFTVSGISNAASALLDDMAAEPKLKIVSCYNELNAGYAADGYARARGVGACVVSNGGSLFLLNAVAGAYSADLPVICIVIGSSSHGCLNGTIFDESIIRLPDLSPEYGCFKSVTCHQAIIANLKEACQQIDSAFVSCLTESKPVYISVSSNLSVLPHEPFLHHEGMPISFYPRVSNQMEVEAAGEAVLKLLNNSLKPVIVVGPKLRQSNNNALNAFAAFTKACGYAVAVLSSAKGLVSEQNINFIGTYWGILSTKFCCEIVETADTTLFVGPIFDDISSVGHSLQFNKDKAIIVEPKRVIIPNGRSFGSVYMDDFFEALLKKVKYNRSAYEMYCKLHEDEVQMKLGSELKTADTLTVDMLYQRIQNMLSREIVLISDCGDAWFRCQKLKLPKGCRHEIQILYASIGWSLGATLGYAQAEPTKRVIACLGDGSFQMAPQEISTMIQSGQRNIIFAVNNGSYSTEDAIHEGPYNDIKNWDYTAYVNAMNNGTRKCWTAKVCSEKELVVAIEQAMGKRKDHCCFIEVIVDRQDISKELQMLGSKVATSNSHPPN